MLVLILLPAWNEEGEDLMWHFNQKGMEGSITLYELKVFVVYKFPPRFRIFKK